MHDDMHVDMCMWMWWWCGCVNAKAIVDATAADNDDGDDDDVHVNGDDDCVAQNMSEMHELSPIVILIAFTSQHYLQWCWCCVVYPEEDIS